MITLAGPDGAGNSTIGALLALNTIDDIVEFYQREYPKRIQRLRSTPGE
jgi:shikimate kinase